MKRTIALVLISASCTASLLLPAAAAPAAQKKTDAVAEADSINSDWSSYSWGLHYKNLALRERERRGKEGPSGKIDRVLQ